MSPTNQQPPTKIRTVGDVLRKFGLLTSVRGVPRILKAQNAFWCAVWAVFVVVFFVTSSYQVITLISNYYDYPKKQWQEIQMGARTDFPGVTLCNLHSLGSKWKSLKTFSPQTLTPDEYFENVSKYIPHWSESLDVWDKLLSTTGYYQNIAYDVAKRYGPNDEELIVFCEVKVTNGSNTISVPCQRMIVDSAQYFNCYTVGAGEEQQNKIVSIDIILYLDDFSSNNAPGHLLDDFQSQMHGARVTIHPYGSYPDIETDGLDVYPGTSVHFRFETRRWEHINIPVGNCDQIEHDLIIQDEHGEEYEYSLWHCRQLCKQRHIIKRCGCRSPDIPIGLEDETLGLQYCAYLDDNITLVQERLKCLANTGLNYVSQEWQRENCDCPHPCKYYRYPSTMTMSKWPHSSFQLAFFDRHIKNTSHYPRKFKEHYIKIQETMSENKTKAFEMLRSSDMIDRNFVRMTVTKPDNHVTVIKEKLEITATQLVSSIGGAFSFWLGITVVTVIEILELIYDFIKIGVLKLRGKGRSRESQLERNDSKNSANGRGSYSPTRNEEDKEEKWPT